MITILAAILGAFVRLILGGMFPQVRRWAALVMFLALGVGVFWEHGLLPALIVSAVLTAGWTAPHGKWLGPKPDTLIECCKGMAARYGLQTLGAGLAMVGCNYFLGAHFMPWVALCGFLAGLVMLALYFAHWELWTLKPVFDPWRGNNPFEAFVGALIYGAMTFA